MTERAVVREVAASVPQRMLWMLDHHRAHTGCLNYPLLLSLTGDLERAGLARALSTVVERHEALRTTYERRRGRLTQMVHAPEPVELTDGGTVPPQLLDERVDREIATPIDPRRECVRATVWSTAPDEHVLCFNVHHLNTDAWSSQIVVNELSRLLSGREDLPRVRWQLRHALEWQRRQERANEEAHRYWTRQLDGASPVPLRAEPGDDGAGEARWRLGPAEVAALRRLAQDERTTLFAVLAATVVAAIARELDIGDVCLASPFANRGRTEVMETVGMFANLVILRVRVPRGAGLADVVRETARVVDEARRHQQLPYAVLPVPRLEDVVFQLLPPLPSRFDCGTVELRVLPPRVASRFPFEITTIAENDAILGLVQHSSVDQALARRIAGAVAAPLVDADRQ
jgi:hypothetical protein